MGRSRYWLFLRSVQNSLHVPSSCKQRWWKTSGEQALCWWLPGISPESKEAHIKHQEHMWTAAMGGNRSSYEVCFRFFPQTQLHMLLHFSSLQSDLCGMLPNIAVSVPIRGLASAHKELCTEAGPTSARAGRTNITAWNAPALLQLSTETPRSPCISQPAVPQGNPVWSSCPCCSSGRAVASSWGKTL